MQNAVQKEDMALVFKGFKNYKNLDYIAAWFIKGANYIQKQNAQFAFVSTNSICQGEQVALLWPHIFDKNLEIGFAHTSFKWNNNAKANAGVTVIIVGIRNNVVKTQKYIFNENSKFIVNNINAYLSNATNVIFERRSISLSKFSELVRGSMPSDGGNFTLTFNEKENLLKEYPNSNIFIKRYLSGGDFLNDNERWCLWIEDDKLKEANNIPFIKNRLNAVRDFRLKSDAPSTVEYANYPNRFRQIAYKDTSSIAIPLTSSERRKYIPMKFLNKGTVVTNSAGVIYEAEISLFSVINSLIHNVWIKSVCGSLENRIRYSAVLGYNNFPFPPISKSQKEELEQSVFRILEERENHSEKTLAQLYDPEKMPQGLREAHRLNDLAVERCYRSKPFETDEERLEYLFKLYEQMIAAEKQKGTLFEEEKKAKKTRKTK
jgi:hypothetical protein